MRKLIMLMLCLTIISEGSGQTLPAVRAADWSLAGLRDTTTAGFVHVDMIANGAIGDGISSNDSVLAAVLNSSPGPGIILNFGYGNFLFNSSLLLPDNTVIRGQGPANTTLSINLNGGWHSIRAEGSISNSDTSAIITTAYKDSSFIHVSNPVLFSVGDWVMLSESDSDLVTSSWAIGTTGQILRITGINGNKILLASALRRGHVLSRSPFIKKITARKNIGIECVKIQRLDNAAPNLSSNLYFKFAVNCWVSGVESFNCTFSHLEAESSSNLHISRSYFHHGFDYGDGGRAYGIVFHFTTGESRAEDNIFERLRHSMLLQAGANGNVFAYNYSIDPFWSSSPSDAAGDMVLHGNYPYSNLFEQNIGQNIIIDNSHGPNGPFNTFFRNRAERFGIYFSAANSPNQNLIGTEIPNTSFPYSLVNYTIQGSGHFVHGNNNKGSIQPPGTQSLPDESYAYTQRPAFIPSSQWAGIGTPNAMNSKSIPAKDRFSSGNIFSSSCGNITVDITSGFPIKKDIVVYPNPASSVLQIHSNVNIRNIQIQNQSGQFVYQQTATGSAVRIDTSAWTTGLYYVRIYFSDDQVEFRKFIKMN